jgi:hypothetical protein
MQRTLLALALIAFAGVSYAQAQTTVVNTTTQTRPAPQAMPTNEPRDPYGNPLIGRNDWVAQPGDRTNAGAAPSMHRRNMTPDMAQAPSMQSGPRQSTFKDEYGFRYDAQGNRLDARGNIISPQTR